MSEITTDYDKIPQLLQFSKFLCIFFKFWQTLWIGRLKSVNKEKICSPVGFSDALILVFYLKMSQTNTEYDKSSWIFQFAKVLCHFFFKFLTDFVNWNIEKGQQRKNV